MDYRVSALERAAFKRCRRQWDFGSTNRQRLQALDPEPIDLNQAIRDALAVYYYPGMWDWQSSIVLPLVRKAFMRSIAAAPPSADRMQALDLGTELLERYFDWAPSVDDFGPLKIEADVEVIVPDIREPGRGLLSPDGQRVLYTERVALVGAAVDDEYWVVLHHVVPDWQDIESLLLDEAAIAACWAWEQTYLGMDVAGTIHNEMLRAPPDVQGRAPAETRTGQARPRRLLPERAQRWRPLPAAGRASPSAGAPTGDSPARGTRDRRSVAAHQDSPYPRGDRCGSPADRGRAAGHARPGSASVSHALATSLPGLRVPRPMPGDDPGGRPGVGTRRPLPAGSGSGLVRAAAGCRRRRRAQHLPARGSDPGVLKGLVTAPDHDRPGLAADQPTAMGRLVRRVGRADVGDSGLGHLQGRSAAAANMALSLPQLASIAVGAALVDVVD